MVTKTISGNVLLDTAIVGNFTIEYEDAKESKLSEAKEVRTLTVTVYLDTSVLGSVSLSYEDLIASGAGGKRTVTLRGDVEV